MSPEQSIAIAKQCVDYKKGNTFKYPADYVMHNESCKSCLNWQAGKCKTAYDILNSLE